MSNDIGRYAQLATGSIIVENVILMSAGFEIPEYYFVKLSASSSCQPGAYYNDKDGKFYLDSSFENECGTINETDEEPSS